MVRRGFEGYSRRVPEGVRSGFKEGGFADRLVSWRMSYREVAGLQMSFAEGIRDGCGSVTALPRVV